MFTAMSGHVPKLVTRKAMVILNIQNDSFIKQAEFVVCQPQDFVDRIKAMVPYFRRVGELVWVRTEFLTVSAAPKTPAGNANVRGDALQENEIERTASLSLDDAMDDNNTNKAQPVNAGKEYFPTSRARAVLRRASAKARSEKRDEQLQLFVNNEGEEDVDAYLSKPRKGQPPTLYIPGTRGAAFTDGIKPFIDEEKDMLMVKHHYSAFDATPLLISLRMRLVTHIYLCGCLSNVSIYATAADAVRHGFEVTVVEDCMGYRSELKHLNAMRDMADLLGVSGIDSEELIDQSGGQAPPDAEVPIFTGPGIQGINPLAQNHEEYSGHPYPSRLNITSGMVQGVSPNNQLVGSSSAAAGVRVGEQHEQSDQPNLSPVETPSPGLQSVTSTAPDADVDHSRKKTLGPGDRIGEGDSMITYDALPTSLANDAFDLVKKEVGWQAMKHRTGEVPRRVAVQGEIGKDGSRPLFRHPADESPPLSQFSQTVQRIQQVVQKKLKQPFNHALIQLYRDGQDNISEHSDKVCHELLSLLETILTIFQTLDIVRGSKVVNLSLGAQRVMTLRTKKSKNARNATSGPAVRQSQRVPLPHNSVFILGPQTNRHWLHGIRPDKRPLSEKSLEERAFHGERISITLRYIGTFTDKDTLRIWGQGAISKSHFNAGDIATNNTAEMESMIIAFGKENRQVDFDWDAEYGSGFDVVNLVSSITQLFLSNDNVANLRVMLSLFERGVPCEISQRKTPNSSNHNSSSKLDTMLALPGEESLKFRDIDEDSSEIVGDLAILFYLAKFYPILPSEKVSERQLHQLTTRVYSRVTQANELLYLWQELQGRGSHSLRRPGSAKPVTTETTPLESLLGEMEIWEEYAEEAEYVGGDFYSIIDCALWPVLNEIVEQWDGWSEQKYPDLAAYHGKVKAMPSVQKALSYMV